MILPGAIYYVVNNRAYRKKLIGILMSMLVKMCYSFKLLAASQEGSRRAALAALQERSAPFSGEQQSRASCA